MYAVITAGGTVRPEFAQVLGTAHKALAPLGSRRLIDPVIDAARAIGAQIAVVCSPAVGAYCAPSVDCIVAAQTSGAANIALALRAFPAAERLVFLTCDMPFIDAPALQHFVDRSTGYGLTMALAPGEHYTAEYPGAPSHTVRLGRQHFANGSAFVIDRSAIASVERVAGRFFSARKSLPRLATLLGPALCLRFALGRLHVADIERRASAVLGVAAGAVVDAAPSLCYDVDDIADWAYAHSLCQAYG